MIGSSSSKPTLPTRIPVAKAVRGVDCIFHDAALASVPRSVERPLDTNSACVTGTLNLLDQAQTAGVRRLVYAGFQQCLWRSAHVVSKRETDLPAPISPYGAAKLAAEYYCQAFTATLRLRDRGHPLLQRVWPAARSQ